MTLVYVLINQQKKRNKHKARIRRNQRIVMTRWTMLPGAKSTKLGLSSLYKQFKVGIFVSRCKKYKVGILFNVQKYNVGKVFCQSRARATWRAKTNSCLQPFRFVLTPRTLVFFKQSRCRIPYNKQLSRAQILYLYDVYILSLQYISKLEGTLLS